MGDRPDTGGLLRGPGRISGQGPIPNGASPGRPSGGLAGMGGALGPQDVRTRSIGSPSGGPLELEPGPTSGRPSDMSPMPMPATIDNRPGSGVLNSTPHRMGGLDAYAEDPASWLTPGPLGTYPKQDTKVALQVSFLTSCNDTASATTVHLFQVEKAVNPSRPSPQRRLLALADKTSFAMGLEETLRRSAKISSVKEFVMSSDDYRNLMGPLTECDTLLHRTGMIEFVRMMPAVFKPPFQIPLYTLAKEISDTSRKLDLISTPNALDPTYGSDALANDFSKYRVKAEQQVEGMRLAVDLQKKTATEEQVKLHQEIEQLRFNLYQTESQLMQARRMHRDEKEILLNKIAFLEHGGLTKGGQRSPPNLITPVPKPSYLLEKLE